MYFLIILCMYFFWFHDINTLKVFWNILFYFQVSPKITVAHEYAPLQSCTISTTCSTTTSFKDYFIAKKKARQRRRKRCKESWKEKLLDTGVKCGFNVINIFMVVRIWDWSCASKLQFKVECRVEVYWRKFFFYNSLLAGQKFNFNCT